MFLWNLGNEARRPSLSWEPLEVWMADSLEDRGPQDPALINVRVEQDVKWWTEKLGVSQEQLIRAVSEVGPAPARVAKFLNRSLYIEE